MFSYNSKDAETAWPEGQYQATFLGAVDGKSKSSGADMQTWTFEVYDNTNYRKQTITEYVTAAALFRVRQLAQALNRADEFKANRFHPEDYAGSAVMVELKVEQQDGFDDRNRINRISPRPPATPSSQSQQAKAPAQRRQTAADIMAPNQPQAASVGAGDAPPLRDEDIPF